MRKIIINGGASLQGEVKIGGSKNSVVALIPAAILCKDKVRLYNYPNISDVEVLIDILKDLNVTTRVEKDFLEIDSTNVTNTSLISEKMTLLRASYYFMGALLALFNQAELSLPGGCYLGPRPIDLHIKGLKQLNCEIDIDKGIVRMHSDHLIGDKIFLDIASVGATVNIILASVFINGETIIENAAKEPEIIDLANFLNSMGANIEGAGTGIIKITGVKKLYGSSHNVIPDRIEAGTYILFGAASGKELIVNKIEPLHLNALIAKLNEANVELVVEKDRIIVSKPNILLPLSIRTAVYPGFPTDLQQVFTALVTQASGVSVVNETIYSSRFKNCDDLIKMGAKIQIENSSAIIFGPSHLKGAEVAASDLRGGASLILAGLVAEGNTIIDNVEHIYRGYGNIVENLKLLNAKIKLVEY